MVSDTVALPRRRGPTRVRRLRALLRRTYRTTRTTASTLLQAASERRRGGRRPCDTNGGMLPSQIARIVGDVLARSGVRIGIHCQDDTGLRRGQHARGRGSRRHARAVHGERLRRAHRQRRPVRRRGQPRAEDGACACCPRAASPRRSGSPMRSRRSRTWRRHPPAVCRRLARSRTRRDCTPAPSRSMPSLYNHVDATSRRQRHARAGHRDGRPRLASSSRAASSATTSATTARPSGAWSTGSRSSRAAGGRSRPPTRPSSCLLRDEIGPGRAAPLRRRVVAHDRRAARGRRRWSRRRPSRCTPAGERRSCRQHRRGQRSRQRPRQRAARGAGADVSGARAARARRLQGAHPRGRAGHRRGDPRARRHQRRRREWTTVGVHENVIAASWLALEDAVRVRAAPARRRRSPVA